MPTQQPVIRFTNPSTIAAPRGYSHIAEVTGGKTIYIAGQVAQDSNGNLVGKGDLGVQTQQVFDNLKAALEAVGADFDSVVKLNFYLRDITQVQAVREIRDRYVNTQHPPVSTAVQVGRLVNEDWLIEVDAVAVVAP